MENKKKQYSVVAISLVVKANNEEQAIKLALEYWKSKEAIDKQSIIAEEV